MLTVENTGSIRAPPEVFYLRLNLESYISWLLGKWSVVQVVDNTTTDEEASGSSPSGS